ncbi:hypothetical protein E6C27_scaffold46635G00160 [Cucumis melo var. makuwa]|uniref:Uncharacterized protein n=1 Tax=Cucumis melo var. makuwa TaxID=1194695 RepID=A0A5A7U7B3_CUCMM|nr:hypothetical protein E6C27_scaffold46635G00160 [Cucumis melo var. makuwa]
MKYRDGDTSFHTRLFPAINLAILLRVSPLYVGIYRLSREYQVDRQGFAPPLREEGWRDTSRPISSLETHRQKDMLDQLP